MIQKMSGCFLILANERERVIEVASEHDLKVAKTLGDAAFEVGHVA